VGDLRPFHRRGAECAKKRLGYKLKHEGPISFGALGVLAVIGGEKILDQSMPQNRGYPLRYGAWIAAAQVLVLQALYEEMDG
jgi:hypothetical protein